MLLNSVSDVNCLGSCNTVFTVQICFLQEPKLVKFKVLEATNKNEFQVDAGHCLRGLKDNENAY